MSLMAVFDELGRGVPHIRQGKARREQKNNGCNMEWRTEHDCADICIMDLTSTKQIRF